MRSDQPRHSVSFVVPCLNEERTLPFVLEKIKKVCAGELRNRNTEIIVADNGSTDGSREIAVAHAARVVDCQVRGYGAALQYGIRSAANDIIVFADADGTYDFTEAPRLVEELERGYDLVIGSRLKGNVHPGAMPFLHRYIGTPALNVLINSLYSHGRTRISDCNSGFRCVRRDSFLTWNVKSMGMEFASEMLVRALKSGARISEVPISLLPDSRDRTPHLKTWRDGMRHLLQILLEAPNIFHHAGSLVYVASWLTIVVGLVTGPVQLGGVSVFGIHTMMFGLLGSLFGLSIWGIGLFLAAKQATSLRTYRYVLDMSEDKVFWYSVLFAGISAAFFGWIVIEWARHGFRELRLEKETLALIAFGSNGVSLVASVITGHLMKRT